MKQKIAIILFSLFFGWLAGHLHAFVQSGARMDAERQVMDQVELTMQAKKPFRLFGQYKFYPTENGYMVIAARASQ